MIDWRTDEEDGWESLVDPAENHSSLRFREKRLNTVTIDGDGGVNGRYAWSADKQ